MVFASGAYGGLALLVYLIGLGIAIFVHYLTFLMFSPLFSEIKANFLRSLWIYLPVMHVVAVVIGISEVRHTDLIALIRVPIVSSVSWIVHYFQVSRTKAK